MTYLTCKGLTMAYDGQIALRDISFSVKAGDFLSILGENGSGKSTLVKGLLGLQPLRAGEIIFDGIVRKQIGYLPQQTQVQRDFPASVGEVVLSGCLSGSGHRSFYTKEQKKIAQEKMQQLGISTFVRRSYRELSGGQQQRVLLARALCSADKLLLLDEPVTGLDPVVTAELYDLLKRLNKEHGVTIMMVSHDLHGALLCANKILHLHTDQFFFGTLEAYKNSAEGRRMIGGDADAANDW